MVRQVCYLSTARSEYGTGELDAILAASRRNNERDDLTGMLAYGGGVFFQVLEGPHADTQRALDRIVTDPRHHGIFTLQDEDRPARDFAHWRMAYRILNPSHAQAIRRHGFVDAATIPELIAGLDNPLVSTFLKRFTQAA